MNKFRFMGLIDYDAEWGVRTELLTDLVLHTVHAGAIRAAGPLDALRSRAGIMLESKLSPGETGRFDGPHGSPL